MSDSGVMLLGEITVVDVCYSLGWKGLFLLHSSMLVQDKHLFFFFYTDEVIDETYGVAVQFDEEEEEVILNIKSDKNLC